LRSGWRAVASVDYAARARRDLLEIAEHISIERPLAAQRALAALIERVDRLADFPELGQSINALGPGVRRLSVPPWLVVYEYRDDRVRIIRILHAARNWPR